MQWRKAAAVGGAVGGAALGAAALYNAAATRGIAPLDNALGGEPGEILWRGHRIAYTRHGQGSPVLLVHGMYLGASSLEWRHTVASLAENHSVIAVDLLGFGRSSRPDARYTPALYQALIADVIARVVCAPCVVVASSLSAAQVVALAARDPRYIAGLALIAPTGVAHLREPVPQEGSTAHRFIEAPIIGDAIYNGLTSPDNLHRQLRRAYADDRMATPALVETYVRAARQPGAKHVISAYLAGRLNVDVRNALRRVRQPTLLLWGALAHANPVEHAHAFRVLKTDLQWTLVPDAGDLPHDERPDEVNQVLRSFLERTRQGTGAHGPRLAMA
jgi:pimeloyl-ACP methyl ester carboxylesterase